MSLLCSLVPPRMAVKTNPESTDLVAQTTWVLFPGKDESLSPLMPASSLGGSLGLINPQILVFLCGMLISRWICLKLIVLVSQDVCSYI